MLIVGYVDTFRDRFRFGPICRVLTEHDLPIAASTYHACKTQHVSGVKLADAWVANTALDVWEPVWGRQADRSRKQSRP